MPNETVLITGASSGIGLELAREFARHGHPLILTAPVEAELQEISRELESNHRVMVRVIARDLRQPESPEEIYDAVNKTGAAVDILVNNAGLGHLGRFWEISTDEIFEMIRVNLEAVVRLSRLFLPDMIARGRGRLVTTASVAGFEPGPRMATYHATKAFVLSLSESLAAELEGTGVTVTAICPGVTDTDFLPKAGMEDTKLFQSGNVMAPQEVAEQGWKALMRGDSIYVVGGMNKAQVFARRFMTKSAQAKASKKLYEDVPPEKRKRRRGDVEAEEQQKKAA